MDSLIETYHKYFIELADKRCYNWLFMSGPHYPTAIILLYLYLIYRFLPNFMEKRKAYDLKLAIQLYNICQVVFCLLIIHGLMVNGWTTHLTLGCEPIDYTDNEMAVNLLKYCWWTMALKMFELIETFIFALRKKQNQITKLHVYHHTSTFLATWITVKYAGGGMVTFPILLNSAVHVLMYIYYFLSSLGPNIQRRLSFIKSKLTTIQMIQFCIMLVHAFPVLSDDCKISIIAPLLFIPNVLLIFGMFINFYIQQYIQKSPSKKAKM